MTIIEEAKQKALDGICLTKKEIIKLLEIPLDSEEDKLLRDNKKALIIAKKIKPIKLSSTIIREKIKNGEEVESFFKKEVLEYINKNGLYKL